MTGWNKLSTICGKPWNRRLLCGSGLALCLYVSAMARAQPPSQPVAAASVEGKSAQGTLTVTATVVSSLGFVIGPNGEQALIVANSPAGDNKLLSNPVQTRPTDPTRLARGQHEHAEEPGFPIPQPQGLNHNSRSAVMDQTPH